MRVMVEKVSLGSTKVTVIPGRSLRLAPLELRGKDWPALQESLAEVFTVVYAEAARGRPGE